jgi:ferritin
MTEFGGPGDGDKGDALYAMELALSLEKLNFQKLRALQAVADKHGDAQMSDFVESDLLAEQVRPQVHVHLINGLCMSACVIFWWRGRALAPV